MSIPSMSRSSVTERLRKVASLADLTPSRRLVYKIDMSPGAVTARLRQVEALRRLCLRLAVRTVEVCRCH